jgi:hypothetical protein
VAVLRSELFDDELFQKLLDVLEVGHITTRTDNGILADWMEPLYVLKAGERPVRG